jgi:hypothetical protein
MQAVVSYLRRTRQTITCTEGTYALASGIPNVNMIEHACRDRAISLAENGSIQICGIRIRSELDTVRIRRRVEDHLRKFASPEEIIRIASCLGVNLK